MGNAPIESNMGDSLKCCKCNTVLPPCPSFNNFYRQILHGRQVYVYNGGEYFRPVGDHNAYECAHCFNQPIRDQDRMRREDEERRRQDEVRRKQEEERRRQDEEKRKEEEERKEEERKKKDEMSGGKQLNILDLLFRTVDDLGQADLKRFKTHLSERTLEGCEPIPRGKLENSDATDVADQVKQAYGEDRAVKMTLTILRKMNCNDLADKLQRSTKTV